MATQRVLDPACGGRMFWFDKNNPEAVFGDIRRESGIIYDGRDGRRSLCVAPDQIMDFTDLPYPDGRFHLVVFDPPHLLSAGERLLLHSVFVFPVNADPRIVVPLLLPVV